MAHDVIHDRFVYAGDRNPNHAVGLRERYVFDDGIEWSTW